ncbi:MAG TPA: amidase [Gemmatimonadetes bacterium]|nr:amidase [Gemmatimonadota bacterium]
MWRHFFDDLLALPAALWASASRSVPSRLALVVAISTPLAACSTGASPAGPPRPAGAARPVVLLADPSPGAFPAESTGISEVTVQSIQAAYAAGEYSAVDLTRAFLGRIDQYESHYNALISMNPDALATAAALDVEYASTGPRGPLHGVPVVIKDNLDYGGLVTTAGFDGFSEATGGIDMIPQADATVVARLREAGAIVLGKTNLPDFAGDGTRTRSTVAGVTLNPYDPERAPGGSSGGTATAVNASFAVLGLGTETGGSIQNPAAAQALVGVKPTFGLVPLDGVVPIDATYLDVVGPLAKTVYDAALTLDVISGPAPADLASYAGFGRLPEEGYAALLTDSALEGKRFGLVGVGWRNSWLPLAPETEALYQRAISVLTSEGAVVVDDPFLNSEFIELYQSRPRVPSVGAHDLLVYLQRLGDQSPFHSVAEWEALTGQQFPQRAQRRSPARPSATEDGDAFQAWRREMRELYRAVLEVFELDGLFFPQAGAPIRDLVEDPSRPEYSPNNHPELPSNIVNALGVPVVTVPSAYYDDGTPFVVVFIGDTWTEAKLLAYAYDFEQATLARVPPKLVAKEGS